MNTICGLKPVRAEFHHTLVASTLVWSQQVVAVRVSVRVGQPEQPEQPGLTDQPEQPGHPGLTELTLAIIRCAYPIILDKAEKLQSASNTSRASDPSPPPPPLSRKTNNKTNRDPARQSPPLPGSPAALTISFTEGRGLCCCCCSLSPKSTCNAQPPPHSCGKPASGSSCR